MSLCRLKSFNSAFGEFFLGDYYVLAVAIGDFFFSKPIGDVFKNGSLGDFFKELHCLE